MGKYGSQWEFSIKSEVIHPNSGKQASILREAFKLPYEP
jgi:hypothetical protein